MTDPSVKEERPFGGAFAQQLDALASELRDLRIRCGSPTLRALEKAAPRARPLSQSAISEALSGKRLPRLEFLITLVQALLGTEHGQLVGRSDPLLVSHWRARWEQVERSRSEAARKQPGPQVTDTVRVTEDRPFLLIARFCGLALDTARRNQQGAPPCLWQPHADRHQLWSIQSATVPDARPDELMIISEANGLALDSTTDVEKPKLLMWERHGGPQQRWRLQKSSGEVAFRIQSVQNGRFLTAPEESEAKWTPWFEDAEGSWSQEWILALPHSGNFPVKG